MAQYFKRRGDVWVGGSRGFGWVVCPPPPPVALSCQKEPRPYGPDMPRAYSRARRSMMLANSWYEMRSSPSMSYWARTSSMCSSSPASRGLHVW